MEEKNQFVRYDAAYNYACNIIYSTPKFKDFAIAMMDYIGGPNNVILSIYSQLKDEAFPRKVSIEEDLSVYGDIESSMRDWYVSFQKTQEKRKQETAEDIKEDVDELHRRIKKYRSTDKFREMLRFYVKFHYLSPFNAMLVSWQKPGARFVKSIKNWEKMGRRPKQNGQPLIILVPFSPVQAIFDFSDTEPIPGRPKDANKHDEQMLEEWEYGLNKARIRTGEFIDEKRLWGRLRENMEQYGISYHDDFNSAGSFGGYLEVNDRDELYIRVSNDHDAVFVSSMCRFIINVNRNQSPFAQFHTVCHELGHLFCRHLFYDSTKVRHLTTKEEEFEAETVAWLVCNRHGVDNPSEEYLAGYASDGEMPDYSLNDIMKAVTEIENMISGAVSIQKSLWYKYDSKIKAKVDDAVKTLKEMAAARKASSTPAGE